MKHVRIDCNGKPATRRQVLAMIRHLEKLSPAFDEPGGIMLAGLREWIRLDDEQRYLRWSFAKLIAELVGMGLAAAAAIVAVEFSDRPAAPFVFFSAWAIVVLLGRAKPTKEKSDG